MNHVDHTTIPRKLRLSVYPPSFMDWALLWDRVTGLKKEGGKGSIFTELSVRLLELSFGSTVLVMYVLVTYKSAL